MRLHEKIGNRLARLFDFVLHKRAIYTLWFNFRYLPFRQSVRLPFVFFPHAFAKVGENARIIISDEILNSKSQKIYVGEDVHDFSHGCERTFLNLQGTVEFKGKIRILRGAMVDVFGEISFGNDVVVALLARIRVYEKLSIGNVVRIAHETQIFDTNFHYVVSVDDMEYRPMAKPVVIGNHVWIGNRCTVNAGSIIPGYTIVASNSLVNKDLSYINKYSLVGGVPCKLLKEGLVRIWDENQELKYMRKEFSWKI